MILQTYNILSEKKKSRIVSNFHKLKTNVLYLLLFSFKSEMLNNMVVLINKLMRSSVSETNLRF